MKIFIINLDRCVDRKNAMQKQLDSLNVEYEFISAADGRALTPKIEMQNYDSTSTKRNIQRYLSKNEIACAMSHRMIYKKIIEEGINKACILEDDIVIECGLKEVLEQLDTLDLGNCVVKLDNYQEKTTPCSIWRRKRLVNNTYLKKPVTTQWMAWGYVIDKQACEKILGHWGKIEFPADSWKHIKKHVNLLCVQPALVHQNVSMESILDQDRLLEIKQEAESEKKIVYLAKRAMHICKTAVKMLVT